MKKMFSLANSLDAVAALIAAVALLGVLQSFIIGKHFVIPTMFLLLAIIFGNLARFGLRGERWAKQLLFWMFLPLAFHTFFALFWADTARPGQFLGDAFYPVYGGLFILFSVLCITYARSNRLFAR